MNNESTTRDSSSSTTPPAVRHGQGTVEDHDREHGRGRGSEHVT